ncbi:diguanylate cyclase (GGDEF) domain-containing protein [Lachnospiraceae bacterium]|nr:diguanylate cyclase (GGDEF) domain-containing protein [Lachnospiraceae bacterium]
MIDRICSDNYKSFIRGIDSEHCTISDIADYTRKSMQSIADSLFIGRLEALIEASPNEIDRVGFKGREMLYQSPSGYEPLLYKMDFMTGSGVAITMNAYPTKGYEWNDVEKDDLYFLCSNFFALYERARLASVMKKAVFVDGMTGALNLSGLMRTAGMLKAQGKLQDYTVAFLNIKSFKLINRHIGMKQGDKILRSFIDDLYSFKLQEEMIGRLGGDNFVIVMKDDRVDAFIDHLNPLPLEVTTDGKVKTVELTFRIGLFDITEDDNMGEAINNSSTALALTKIHGNEDVIWFTDDMREEKLSEQRVTYFFNKALVNREFVVYYQPKVSLEDSKLCGSEALVRWVSEGEVIPPLSFIPTLEREGTICELDFYVFETVCRDIREWLDRGVEPINVSVNFSKNHLKNDDFSSRILSIISLYNIDPKYIEVELTETACYEDYNKLKKFLSEMKKNNIAVSIDDFGTGYSSLSLLKDLKVDVIKLDQSFIKSIDESEEAQSTEVVIKNIVHMVDELSMKIIAEGVETEREAEFLKKVCCDMAQGYLYDKPMSHDDFEIILRGGRVYKK